MTNTWYYTPDGKSRLGPFSLEQMQSFARSGELKPQYMARHEDAPKWAPAGTFRELFASPQPLVAMPVAQQTAARSAAPAPSAPSVAVKDPASLFDFDEANAEPRAAPTPRRRREEPSPGAKVWAAVGPAVLAVWSVPLATWKEARRRVSLFQLQRQQRRQQREQEQFIVESGIRLLSAGVNVPGCEDFSQRYQQLSHSHQLANQQAVAGNKEKRKEAGRLDGELRSLYADFGAKVLASGVAFAGRDRDEKRKQQIESGLAQTRKEIDARVQEWAAAPPQTKRNVVIGSAAAGVLAVVCVWLLWPSWGERPHSTEPVAVAPEPSKPAPPPEPEKPKTIAEWFKILSPAVPLVEVVDGGWGSGFLVNSKGRYLVVTNRHVVENAVKGLTVHFPLKDKDTRLTIPSNDAKVVAIHRGADLALIDVNGWKKQIDNLHIKPTTLALPDQLPQEGHTVFAIGHPGSGQGKIVLTSTLNIGNVSAVGREMEGARYLQVQTPINPGNSGGPLFDSQGRVVGVNTFIIRSRPGAEVTLEGLNFSLEVAFVQDLLKNPASSLNAIEVAAVVNPPPVEATPKMTMALQAKLEQFSKQGYTPPDDKSTLVFRLKPGEQRILPLLCEKGQYGVAAVSEGVKDLDLGVLGGSPPGWVAECKDARPDPEVKFRAKTDGVYIVFVRNSTTETALVSITRLKKK